jgi:ATP-binding cassette subfamily C protein
MALQRLPKAANEIALTVMVVGSVFYLTYYGHGIESALPTLALFGFAGLRLTTAMTRVNAQFQRLRSKAEEFEKYYRAVVDVAPHLFGDSPPTGGGDYLRDEQPLAPDNDGKLHRALTLEAVSFSYPRAKEEVLHDVSLQVPAGSFVAFCGSSGGGKSTLLLPLMGMMRPSSGSIKCDDWEIHRHIRAWHSNIGYVGQQGAIRCRRRSRTSMPPPTSGGSRSAACATA